jgi:hypothetical protein
MNIIVRVEYQLAEAEDGRHATEEKIRGALKRAFLDIKEIGGGTFLPTMTCDIEFEGVLADKDPIQ